MRIDDRTAIRIARRINNIAMPLLSGSVGDHAAAERRVCRVMRWLGVLYAPLVPWVLDPSLALPTAGDRLFKRGGII